MDYEEMKKLVDKLSCDFVLADFKEPETLSCLLPVLKNLHGKCIQLSLNDQADDILKAKKIIKTLIKDNPADSDGKMAALGELITGLSPLVNCSGISGKQSGKEQDLTGASTASRSETSYPVLDNSTLIRTENNLEKTEKNLEKFSILTGRFCPGEIMDLGSMINILEELIDSSKGKKFLIFREVCIACKSYVENMTSQHINNTKPVEEAIVLLKSILRHIKSDKAFVFDYSDVLELLDIRFKEGQKFNEIQEITGETEDRKDSHQVSSELIEEVSDVKIPDENRAPEKISDDDMEILVDFISEAKENLDTIEVNLIDLEQDPHDREIINEIFRPFHTIKGVSGFLSLKKINKLAHTTENLLDSARSGDFLINNAATDAILESVDLLKVLIERVRQGTETGFMTSDDDIDIDSLKSRLQQLQIDLTKEYKKPIGDILVNKGVVARETIDQALEAQTEFPDKKIGEILVETKKASPVQIASALMEQNPVRKHVATQVKVSTDKLDDLVDYAGELVIAQSMLRQKTAHDQALSQSVAQLGQIVTNMQNIAMSMRMIPIKTTFTKMIRLVRDLSRKSGKEVVLNMMGEDTEIDRNVVDALYEPMVHMIRNSVDHGIESASVRLEQGKPPKGEIVLRAYHKGGHIIIEIEDDGKGLDRDAILAKAKKTGLVQGSEQLTDSQIYDLILQPGFSTAEKITDVSGRGVGMDVVKDGIEKFRGQLDIKSSKGKGTKFTISLPLTLAIIDGMLVKVDNERYVIPTIAIEKAFKPGEKDHFTVEGKGEMISDRGSLIPLIRLNDIYATGTEKKDIHDCLVVVVESKGERKALLIDELLGKDEYVIKSLGAGLENVDGLAGGAILSDGQVGLILDILGIFNLVSRDN